MFAYTTIHAMSKHFRWKRKRILTSPPAFLWTSSPNLHYQDQSYTRKEFLYRFLSPCWCSEAISLQIRNLVRFETIHVVPPHCRCDIVPVLSHEIHFWTLETKIYCQSLSIPYRGHWFFHLDSDIIPIIHTEKPIIWPLPTDEVVQHAGDHDQLYLGG